MSSWKDCKLGWKFSYIDKMPQVGNAWSDWGTAAHEVLEAYAKREMSAEAMTAEFMSKINGAERFPFATMTNSYLNKAEKFFDRFANDESNYRAVPIELEPKFQVELDDDNDLIGYIDKLARIDGKLTIVDYKISKRFGEKLRDKSRQLLLYSKYVIEKYNEVPDMMFYHIFGSGDKDLFGSPIVAEIERVEWTQAAYDEAFKWALDSIAEIEAAKELGEESFQPTVDDFFCGNLCGHREHCPMMNNFR